jgi:hypothetical protein
MPWTFENQQSAEGDAAGFLAEFIAKWSAWQNSLRSGSSGSVGQAAVEDVVRRWQQSLQKLQAQSEFIASSDNAMDELGQMAVQVAEEKSALRKLRGEAITRADQADSLNPKVRSSPYTNLLGLERVFRSSTRVHLVIASIVFAILALGALTFLVYHSITTELLPPGLIQAGGHQVVTRTK